MKIEQILMKFLSFDLKSSNYFCRESFILRYWNVKQFSMKLKNFAEISKMQDFFFEPTYLLSRKFLRIFLAVIEIHLNSSNKL